MSKLLAENELVSFMFAGFLNTFHNADVSVPENVTIMDDKKNVDRIDYLQKGERLIDMARSIYHRSASKLSLTEAEQRIFSFDIEPNMSFYSIVKKISRSFTRPCLKSIVSVDDAYAKMLLSAIELPGLNVSIDLEEDSFYKMYIHRAIGQHLPSDDMILRVSLQEKDYPVMYAWGTKNTTHKKKNLCWDASRYNLISRYVCVVDMADYFSALIIFTQVMKMLQLLHSLSENEKRCDELYYLFEEAITSYADTYARRRVMRFSGAELGIETLSQVLTYPLHVYERDMNNAVFLSFLYSKGVQIIPEPKPSWKWRSYVDRSLPNLGIENMHDFSMCFLLRNDFTCDYHSFVRDNRTPDLFWGLPLGMRSSHSSKIYDTDSMKLFAKLFCIIATAKHEKKQMDDYYKDLEKSTHAKSYQLKKSIPQKVLSAMESSLFNKYFGFVEFDELTDLAAAEEIAKEFEALKEKYLGCIDSKENAIRFRKLGNHNAVGLYYPSVKCLCVDIHCPSSLTHEYGHLIDYTMDNLSTKMDFYPIKKWYTEHLYNRMFCDSGFREKMKSRSKYSLSYYSMPTEIFARSFELYVAKILGVKNSIVPVEFSEDVYPTDAAFLELIASYFNNLLGNNCDKEPMEVTDTVRWLISCPAGDGNFLIRLKSASIEEIQYALADETVKTQTTKTKKLQSALRKLMQEKEC